MLDISFELFINCKLISLPRAWKFRTGRRPVRIKETKHRLLSQKAESSNAEEQRPGTERLRKNRRRFIPHLFPWNAKKKKEKKRKVYHSIFHIFQRVSRWFRSTRELGRSRCLAFLAEIRTSPLRAAAIVFEQNRARA